LIKIDADHAPDLVEKYLIDSIPSFVVVKENWDNILHVKSCSNKEDVRKIFDTAIHNTGEDK
jgi:thioredoxin-like negative regulator of GroEL